MKPLFLIALLLPLYVFAAEPEATSLLGKPLYRPSLEEKTLAEFEDKLSVAASEFANSPNDPDKAIWLGRRTAYLGLYKEAIRIYSRAIEKHPGDPRLYRHRGHRYLTVREIDRAIQDFEKAAQLVSGKPDQIEPDGLPNAKNIPTSTLNTNIFYHLGLAHYLKADFQNAERAYRECLKFTKNDDMLVAVTHWLYMTLRRQGKTEEATQTLEPIHEKMNVIEDFDYQTLCLLYKGKKRAEDLLKTVSGDDVAGATIAYGIGNWYFYNNQKDKAFDIFNRIIDGKEWAAFGYLAAEAEIARVKKK